LKSVSRTRSGVGLMAADAGKRSFLPRHVPPIMRKTRDPPARPPAAAGLRYDLPRNTTREPWTVPHLATVLAVSVL